MSHTSHRGRAHLKLLQENRSWDERALWTHRMRCLTHSTTVCVLKNLCGEFSNILKQIKPNLQYCTVCQEPKPTKKQINKNRKYLYYVRITAWLGCQLGIWGRFWFRIQAGFYKPKKWPVNNLNFSLPEKSSLWDNVNVPSLTVRHNTPWSSIMFLTRWTISWASILNSFKSKDEFHIK